MKRRLKEMEEEAAALREMQAKVAKEMQGCLLDAFTMYLNFIFMLAQLFLLRAI